MPACRKGSAVEKNIQFEIVYTESAILDIEEKADYISGQLREPSTAEKWYLRLRRIIQAELSTLPLKFPLYDRTPWNQRGIRLMAARNDVVLYSVDERSHTVYIRAVCTKGRDLSAHLGGQE